MAQAVVDPLHIVDVDVNQAARCPVALGEGEHARQFTQEGTPVEARRQGVLVGQGRQTMGPFLLTFQVQTQMAQLADEPRQGRTDLGREFALGDAQESAGTNVRSA
jgi:hypothetical protein